MHKLIECFWFFINSKPLTYFCYKRYFIYSLLFDIFWNYRLMMKTHFLQKFLRVQSEFPFVQLSLQSNTFSPSSKHFQSATSSGSLSFFFSWKSLTPTLNMKNSGDFDPISKCLLRKKNYLLIFFWQNVFIGIASKGIYFLVS